MLPFLTKRKIVSTISAKNKPEGGLEPMDESTENHGLVAAAEDIMHAISIKDAKMLADAIKAAFEMCEEQPHEEGPHITEEK